MKHRTFIIKILCFILGAVMLFSLLDVVIVPKYFYDELWPTTQTFIDFYDMEKDSIDVLFLGSSQGVSSFSPLELYEKYGIRSYNLSSELQNMLLSYYWLKEALRFQSPQVVVLETFMLSSYSPEEPLNSPESTQRKAIDYMKWSSVKREAIEAICEIDESQNALSYYLPHIRFHTRWSNLNEDDFTFCSAYTHSSLLGYSSLTGQSENIEYQPFYADQNAEPAEPLATMLEYMNKIVQLCEDSGISLVLVKTPCSESTINMYNYLNQYAEENDIQYIDFNEESVYSELDYNFSEDNRDYGHPNLWGATKITDYMGKVLTENYGVTAVESDTHEELLKYYEDIKSDCNLTLITDFDEYLDAVNKDRYAVFLSVRDEGTSALDSSQEAKLTELGTTVNFNNKIHYSYYAVINGDKPNEKISAGALDSNGTIRDGAVTYNISSAGYLVGNTSSIMIDGEEYSKNERGMNIVVYCLDTKKVIDSVCFDTFDTLQAKR